MSNKKSLAITKNEEEETKQEIYLKLLLMTQKVFFMQQIKKQKLWSKKQETHYIKDTVFVNIFNKLEQKIF